MVLRIISLCGLTVLLLAALGWPVLASADGPSQAGLIVQFGDDRVETRCVTFEEEQINGADLLTRSGLDVVMDTSGGMGVTICQIEEKGCSYPAERCFCECLGGGECAYWNYFYHEPGEGDWTYSALGAVQRKVGHGSVEAWVWGGGHTPPAADLTFDSICLLPTPAHSPVPPTPPPAPASPTPVPIVATTAPTETPLPTQAPTTLATTSAPSPAPSPSPAAGAGPDLAGYWPFGLMVAGLVVIGVLIWIRQS